MHRTGRPERLAIPSVRRHHSRVSLPHGAGDGNGYPSSGALLYSESGKGHELRRAIGAFQVVVEGSDADSPIARPSRVR